MTALPSALAPMAFFPQWVCWMPVHRPGKAKVDKIPTDPKTKLPINAQLPVSWMDCETAMRNAKTAGLGLGFVFTERDPFFFLDIDECATHSGDGWSPLAHQLISLLPGAAVEASYSGRGLHVFGRCPGGILHGNVNKSIGAELYTSKRFVAIGHGAEGDANKDCSLGFLNLVSTYFPPPPDLTGLWTDEPQPGAGIADDDALINKALNSRSAASTFGDKASFKDLWEGNDLALSVTYPDPARAYDASGADMALAAHLAFWTGGNCEQIERLMLRSGLAREKWEARPDWLRDTITKAVAGNTEVFRGSALPADVEAQKQARIAEALAQPPPPPPPPAANDPGPRPMKDGYPYSDPTRTQQRFSQYVYVRSLDRLISPKGELVSQSQFRAEFRNEEFALDQIGGKTTRNAWKAYMEAEYLNTPNADRICFRPGDSQLLLQDGLDVVCNIWRDPQPRRVKGDPSRFLNHLRCMLPNDDDAALLLAYIAACVQHQGTKFMWCPLIQGVQGNGKSMLGKAVAHAVGEKYVHSLRTDSLRSQFNGWVQGHVLILVEDLHLNGSTATLDMVKPLITADRIPVERKGCDQVMENVCGNFLMTTNHKDAIPLDPDERRWAVFCCAQQSKTDMARSGLTDAYFDSLWRWLEDEDGFAIVADYLWTYRIPEAMNPARLCTTAPETSTHHVALEASRSAEAAFLYEAVDSGAPGFREGWASTTAAMNVLLEHRLDAKPQKVASELTKMGYVRHPGLEGGRTPRNVSVEGKRTRLWVREGHSSWSLRGDDVVKAYEKAQGYAVANVVPLR